MGTFTATRRPVSDEYAPYYGTYIGEVQDGDILKMMEEQIERTATLLGGLGEEAMFRPTPDAWSVKEVICHLCDSERIFSYRALRIARGDSTPMAGFEQNPYVVEAHADVRSLSDLLAEFEAVRQSTLWLFRSLPDEAWDRRGTASGVTFSVLALAYIIVGHTNHHVKSLMNEYLGPAAGKG